MGERTRLERPDQAQETGQWLTLLSESPAGCRGRRDVWLLLGRASPPNWKSKTCWWMTAWMGVVHQQVPPREAALEGSGRLANRHSRCLPAGRTSPATALPDVRTGELSFNAKCRSADAIGITTPSSPKRLRIRYPGQCTVCCSALAAGQEALWDRGSRALTCIGCSSLPLPPVSEGTAGASARREYTRRQAKREQYARERLGSLGVFLARVIEKPQSTRVWRQGFRGEARTAERLAKHLEGSGVRLLHDRRVPRHGQANIDHIAIGPAGVLVIDTKTNKGKVKKDWRGGLFAPRRSVLLINGRDQTRLIGGVERQVGYVRGAVADDAVEVRGALCFPNVDGLPLFSHLSVHNVVIDGPKPIAKLARRPGSLTSERVEQLWQQLGRAFPPA